jgi:methyltransferase (TIGR00027 family)
MRSGRPSVTARWIAAHRGGLHGSRPSTPTGDPDAERRLYQSMGRAFTLPGLRPTGMRERTAFIDQEVARAIGAGVEQIVIVGAGYDGRALRFGGGATRWIEVDFPSTQADKRRRLAALGIDEGPAVAYAGVDLMTDDLNAALAAAGHQVAQPTLLICEGLFAYLSRQASVSLCRTLRERAAPGSVLTFNMGVRPATAVLGQALRGAVDSVLSALGETRRAHFGPGDAELLARASGWLVVRSSRSAPVQLDGGSYLLVVAAEPA